MSTVESHLNQILSKISGVVVTAIKPSDRLAEDLRIDSLDFMELVEAIEDGFGIDHLPLDMPQQVDTVGELALYVKARLQGEQGP